MKVKNICVAGVFMLGALWPGILSAADCVDTAPSAAQAAVEDARRSVLTMEYEATLAKLEEVRRSLPCLTGTIPTDTLAQLYFYEGLLKMNLGDEDAATEAFSDAAAISPLLQEDVEHSSKIREKWAEARDKVTEATGTLLLPDLPSESVAYINGRPLDAGVQSTNVYPGVHLLQVWGDDRRLHGTLMRVRPGETSLVPAEFLTSLTPRGELVLDVRPRAAHVVVRRGKAVVYDFRKAPRRQVVSDVKEGAYIVEVSRPGYYPFSQGKVAVEGEDQTIFEVALKRKPSIGLIARGGGFWVSAAPADSDPLYSIELVGRTGSGWGFHLEYFHHVQRDDDPTGLPRPYETNEDYEEDEAGNHVNGPPEIPNVTTVDLPIGATFYVGVTKQFRIEGVDISLGPKFSMDLFRGSVFAEISIGYDFFPWLGVNLRAGMGAMVHLSDKYIYDKYEDEPLDQYLRFGQIGTVGAGIRVGL